MTPPSHRVAAWSGPQEASGESTLCATSLHCTLLYCTALYSTVLYCTVLYFTVPHCTLLYSTAVFRRIWLQSMEEGVLQLLYLRQFHLMGACQALHWQRWKNIQACKQRLCKFSQDWAGLASSGRIV